MAVSDCEKFDDASV